MNDHKNTILALVLSAMVLIAWQFFFGLPQMEKQRQQQQQQQQQAAPQQPQQGPQPTPQTGPQVPGQAPTPGPQQSREAALAGSPRVQIDTLRLKGSIALRGARIDDLSLS